MNRRAIVTVALVVLLVAVAPAEAASVTRTVSINDTASDFNAAQTLERTVVNGTGTEAFVELDESAVVFEDSFDTETADAGVPDDWEVVNDVSDTLNVTTNQALDGTQSVFMDEDDTNNPGQIRPTEQPYGSARTDNVSVSVWVHTDRGRLRLVESGSTFAIIGVHANSLVVSGTTVSSSLNPNEWVNVTVYNISPAQNNISVQWDSPSDSGTAEVTVSAFTNGYTETRLGVSFNDAAYFDAFEIRSKDATGTYVGQAHTGEDVQQAFANVSITGDAWANVTVKDSSDAVVNTGNFSTTGNHTIDISTSTDTSHYLEVLLNESGGGEAEVHDEGIRATTHEPEFNESTASPANNEELTDDSVTLQVQLNDTDFGRAHGDSVDVEFFVNGTSQGTQTVTSNGTVSLTYTENTGGARKWHAEANDSYGLSNATGTFFYSTPAVLDIREESPPHDKITGGIVEITFFEQEGDNPTIINRSITDGNVSLKGLPTNSEFVAQVETPGYHNRTVFIDSLFDQKTAFLVNTSVPTNEVTFSVNDETGDFDQNAEFVVQKAINRSLYDGTPAGFSWTNAAGDEIGSQNAFTTDLVTEDRYRLRISNGEGDTRLLGAHVPKSDQTVVVTIQDVTIEIENVSADITIGFEKDEANNQIEFLYNDSTGNTTDLEVIIYERGNTSNEVHNDTHAGPFGRLFIEESLTNADMNATWVVEFSGTRGGETVNGQYLTGGRGDVNISAVPQWVKEFAGVFAILLIPTILGGARAETAAIVATAVAAIAWYVRWLPPEISILSILLAATIAVGFKLRERGRGNIA